MVNTKDAYFHDMVFVDNQMGYTLNNSGGKVRLQDITTYGESSLAANDCPLGK